jgi:hypothetical protein
MTAVLGTPLEEAEDRVHRAHERLAALLEAGADHTAEACRELHAAEQHYLGLRLGSE